MRALGVVTVINLDLALKQIVCVLVLGFEAVESGKKKKLNYV